ncbi:alpha/beta fold hydrolase [Burkholderia sp. MSMB1589WGS]|uniref:thioesterase II family protein n=1 Tax=Burkholderia sp. MSMB1589WGS TaxID=1636425 RepID=UPI0007B89F91|nr:alpha/beta fold hydrolase [Burkholderia sp. MSMB1589WGS]
MNERRMLRPWIMSPEPAAWRLVMCPFAGGSSSAFRDWRNVDDFGIDVSLAIYPGRDHRMREPGADDIGRLADQLADELIDAKASPGKLILAGHSMGAQVAFETCERLERRGAPPFALVLSGCHAPHLQGRRLLSHLDDRAFVDQLVEIGGSDATLLSDPSLLAIFLPMLRADFRITEAYRRMPRADQRRIDTPTLLVHGSRDTEASREEVAAWRDWLRRADEPIAMPGDHFYVTRRPRAFLQQILRRLESTSACV